jgi:predicted alpha/beta hydrolase family esterase
MAQGALAAKVRELQDRGIERIGLIAGSLGALPTLHFLRTEALAGAVLVSPVYRCETPPLEAWRHLFDDATRATTTEAMAQAMRTPLLILHGLRDEMAASSQSSRFVANLPSEVPCEYITLADEGHIFSQSASWYHTLAASTRFLREHLHHED